MEMNKIFTFILTVLLLFSCSQTYTPRNFERISLQSISMDSTSIRAIHVVNDSTLYYAGSNGDIGFTNSNGSSWEIEKFQYQDSITPHFRSIAVHKNKIFALAIGSPALLFPARVRPRLGQAVNPPLRGDTFSVDWQPAIQR